MEAQRERPEVGDFYVKGSTRLQVLEVQGDMLKLRGTYGAEFREPIAKLLRYNYALERQPQEQALADEPAAEAAEAGQDSGDAGVTPEARPDESEPESLQAIAA